jgi:hypothetical protein
VASREVWGKGDADFGCVGAIPKRESAIAGPHNFPLACGLYERAKAPDDFVDREKRILLVAFSRKTFAAGAAWARVRSAKDAGLKAAATKRAKAKADPSRSPPQRAQNQRTSGTPIAALVMTPPR